MTLAAPSSAAAGSLAATGALSFPQTQGSGGFDGVSVSSSGDLAVAVIQDGLSQSGGLAHPQYADVFQRQAVDWGTAQPVALLYDSVGGGLSTATISDDLAVAQSGPSTLDVFVPPRGVWTGTITPAARLSASDGADLTSFTAADDSILALGQGATTRAIYVFTPPPGGWAGTLTESARIPISQQAGGPITMSGDELIVGGSASGNTVVTSGSGGEVFLNPSGNWNYAIHPSATLLPEMRPADAGADVYQEPARGWARTMYPSALLQLKGLAVASTGIVGTTVGMEGWDPPNNGVCPCSSGFGVFTEPSGGWSGTVQAVPSLMGTSTPDVVVPPAFAFSGDDVFANEVVAGSSFPPTTLGIYAITPPIDEQVVRTRPVRLEDVSIRSRRTAASVALTIMRPVGSVPLSALTLRLPSALRLASSRSALARGILVSGAATVRRRTTSKGLELTLASAQSSEISISLSGDAVVVSHQLELRLTDVAAYNRRHPLAPAHTVRLTIALTGAVGDRSYRSTATVAVT